MSVLDDLKAAREILTSRWCSRGLRDNKGNVCIVGALNIIVFGTALPTFQQLQIDRRRDPLMKELDQYLPEEYQSSFMSGLALYNDDFDTTHQDVLDLLDRAIAGLS